MKHRLFFIGLFLFGAASCSVDEIYVPEESVEYNPEEVFEVMIGEQPELDTKVFSDDKLRILWNQNDLISVFNLKSFNRKFIFTGETGNNSGLIEPDGEDGSGSPLNHIYAVYPYDESTSINTSGTISFTLPSQQFFYNKDSFGVGANTMVSITDGGTLRFQNACGYLLLKFYGEGVSVSSITLKSNNGELLSGPCLIETMSGEPILTMSQGEASDQVTITCETPVNLGSTSSEAVQFFFVLPPVTLEKGFTATVRTPEGAVFEKSSDKPRVIKRSALTRMGALEVTPELPGNIMFADQAVKAICVKYWDRDNDGGLSYEEAGSVESLMVDETLTRAGNEVSAFAGTGITTFDELVYFTNLNYIEEGAFENCSALKSITVPDKVGVIGANSFDGCVNLESITFTSSEPPTICDGAFDETNECPIYVPEKAVGEYVSNWPEYAERIAYFVLPEYFPDENFRAYVFDNFDKDGDGILFENEYNAVTEINVVTDNISSLEGVDYFKNLEFLSAEGSCAKEYYGESIGWWGNYDDASALPDPAPYTTVASGQLESIVLEGMTKLKTLCIGKNNLLSVVVRDCPSLDSLACLASGVTELDLSTNTNLRSVFCVYNQISSLDLSNYAALSFLDCTYNQIKSLDVRNCANLSVLKCAYNQIGSLDIGDCVNLSVLDCTDNQIKTIDVKKNTAIKELYCGLNELTSIDVSKNLGLTRLSVGSTDISSLDVKSNTLLEALFVGETLISQLDISKNSALTYLHVSYTDLSSLDLRNNTLLDGLVCTNTKITKLDVSNNTLLRNITCTNNPISELLIGDNPSLEYLTCSDNKLESLDLSGCPSLRMVACDRNELKSINVSGCSSLNIISCNNNSLTEFSVTGLPVLINISCMDNLITDLDVSGCTRLSGVSLTNNPLISVNLSGTGVFVFELENSDLTCLNVSNCRSLFSLSCKNNKLTDLDVSGSNLMVLNCAGNSLQSLDLSTLLRDNVSVVDCSNNPSLTEIWLRPEQEISTFTYDTEVSVLKYKE